MDNKVDLNNGETRPATVEELERMKSHVAWIYTQGQPVALWKHSGFITLVPESVSNYEVVFLCRTV